MSSIYIIFLNNEILGYLSDKTTAIQRVLALSEKLTEEERQNYHTRAYIYRTKRWLY